MTVDRRRILQAALGGTSLSPLVLPERWVKPVVSGDRLRSCRGFSRRDDHHDDRMLSRRQTLTATNSPALTSHRGR